jgi:membrane fusion protein, copper/silver efflux system
MKRALAGSWIASAFRLAEVRLRIPIILIVAGLVVGRWDLIRNYWDRFTRSSTAALNFKLPISSDTEYFCPMDPGVVSHGPGRCGVCNMALVRRKRGDAVMLPDGVVARMQLSPYRIQLAGIQTAPLAYQPLNRECSVAGLVAREGDRGATITVELPERQGPWVAEGQSAEVDCADLPGLEPVVGRVRSVTRGRDQSRGSARVVVVLESPPALMRDGMVAVVKFRIAAAKLDPFRTMPANPPPRRPEEPSRVYICHDHSETVALAPGRCPIDGKRLMSQTLGELERLRYWCPMHPDVTAEKSGAVCRQCGGMALQPKVAYFAPQGQVLAIPQSAVIDTGARRVVFVESMLGMFDAVEVVLGPRCGDFYPVVRGVEPGQLVAVAGAFLLDAETRLNPSVAAAYFGAGNRNRAATSLATERKTAAGEAPDSASDPLRGLTPDDRALVERQATCPVSGQPLGSMGAPKRVVVSGRIVYLCCAACEPRLLKQPEAYLPKLPAQDRR